MGNMELIGPISGGREDSYTEELAEEICELIASGKTLLQIEQLEGMPTRRTVNRWLLKYPAFKSQYADARAMQGDYEFELMREKAEDMDLPADQKRIIIDTMKWRAERLNPRNYGARVKHEHSVDEDAGMDATALPGSLAFLSQHKSEGEG
jgi:hypothetical protein